MADTSGVFGAGTRYTPEPGQELGSAADEFAAASGARYRDQLAVAQQLQMQQAQQIYANAGRVGELSAGTLRGRALAPHMTEVASGNALAARQGILAGGQASMGAGVQATQMSSSDRLAAAQTFMQARSQEAAYEQAQMAAYLQRKRAQEEAMAQKQAADAARAAGEKQALMQMIGSSVGAGSSAAVAIGGYGSGGGGGGEEDYSDVIYRESPY